MILPVCFNMGLGLGTSLTKQRQLYCAVLAWLFQITASGHKAWLSLCTGAHSVLIAQGFALKMHKGPQVLNFLIFLQCSRTLVCAASALTCSDDIMVPQSSCADEKHLSLLLPAGALCQGSHVWAKHEHCQGKCQQVRK